MTVLTSFLSFVNPQVGPNNQSCIKCVSPFTSSGKGSSCRWTWNSLPRLKSVPAILNDLTVTLLPVAAPPPLRFAVRCAIQPM